MRTTRSGAVLLAFGLSLSGCFSLVDFSRDGGPRPFGGIRAWVKLAPNSGKLGVWWILVFPAVLVDLPLCLVFDTVTLPIGIVNQAVRSGEEPEPAPAQDPKPRGDRKELQRRRANTYATELARRERVRVEKIHAAYPHLPLLPAPVPVDGKLAAGVHEGNLRIDGDRVEIEGAGIGKTVITGYLEVRGSSVRVTGVTIMKDIRLAGHEADLSQCELKGRVGGHGTGDMPPRRVGRYQTRLPVRDLETFPPRTFALPSGARVRVRLTLRGTGTWKRPTGAKVEVTNLGPKGLRFDLQVPGTPTKVPLGSAPLEPKQRVVEAIVLGKRLRVEDLRVFCEDQELKIEPRR